MKSFKANAQNAASNSIKEMRLFSIIFNEWELSLWVSLYTLVNEDRGPELKNYIADPEGAYLYCVYVEDSQEIREFAEEGGYNIDRAIELRNGE